MYDKYYELSIKVYLINDIKKTDIYDHLSTFINYSFNKSQTLSCLHNSMGLKQYSYSGLYPIEKDGIYKANEIYEFLFRTYKYNMILEEIKCLNGLENKDFIITSVEQREWKHKNINYVDTLTPVIITLKNGRRYS